MELSILQFAKDNHPRTVSIGAVADMIREGRWLSGYPPILLVQGVFEGGTKQSDIIRMSGLAVSCFPPGDGNNLSALRQAARDDPHTLLMFGNVDEGLTVIYAYEIDKTYDVESQRKFYQKVLVYGNDYYEAQLEAPSLRKGKDVGKRCTLCHDPDAYFNPNADWFFAMEILEATRPRSGKLKSTAGLRERKPNYLEGYATLEEVEAFMKQNIELRKNVITSRREFRWLDGGLPIGDGRWRNFEDKDLNDLWRMMEKTKPTKFDYVKRTVESSYSKEFHPFQAYLDSLPPYDGDDYINVLAASVQVAGDSNDWFLFRNCLEKWLVGMVAGWIRDDTVNETVLVFIGDQGIYKTTWMSSLLPPELRSYFYTRTNVGKSDRDTRRVITQFGLICCEELDAMGKREMNDLKADITTAFFDDRQAYERYTEHRAHIASFCATGNNIRFLNDPTGTRRWLPFKVESILSPRDMPFDYKGIYSQAYYLLRNGFDFWFTADDVRLINERNRRFEVVSLEFQLVRRYFRKPSADQAGEFIDVATAMQVMSGNIAQKLNKESVDLAFTKLGFESILSEEGDAGYLAIRRTVEEIQSLGVQMAYNARRAMSDEPF